MCGLSLYAVKGIPCKVNITYTGKGTEGFVWTGLEADFVIVVDVNAAWRLISGANITPTDLRVGSSRE